MNISSGPVPKRAQELLDGDNKAYVYKSTGGGVVAEHAIHNLAYISPIPAGAIIHDNCAGPGTVSRAIMSANPPPPADIKIYATDIDQVFLNDLEKDVVKNSWPIEISMQPSETLNFPDNTFTHSVSNFGIIFTKEGGLTGAKEMYRTLKPGGTAVVNCWEKVTWLLPFKIVHEKTRPGKPFMGPPPLWADGKRIQQIMIDAGFSTIKVEKSEAWTKTTDLRGWAEKSWAFLGGMAGWQESDDQRWDEAVDLLTQSMLEQPGTDKTGDEVRMHTSQWVVIATK